MSGEFSSRLNVMRRQSKYARTITHLNNCSKGIKGIVQVYSRPSPYQRPDIEIFLANSGCRLDFCQPHGMPNPRYGSNLKLSTDTGNFGSWNAPKSASHSILRSVCTHQISSYTALGTRSLTSSLPWKMMWQLDLLIYVDKMLRYATCQAAIL